MTDHCFKYDKTLEDFVEDHGVHKAGELLGLSGSAVHQMLGYRRKVFVKKIKVDDVTSWHYSEVKTWKRGKRQESLN